MRVNLQKTVDYSYPIEIKTGLLEEAASRIRDLFAGHPCALVSDSNVFPLYGKQLAAELREHGHTVVEIGFPAGEQSKCRAVKEQIEDRMLDAGLGRDCFLVALGGGVTGDMGGFVAATYMRGIPFVGIPTSLLAQVDSSVGGKTGLDVPQGKNLIGAFHQPGMVLIDPGVLRSLPPVEYRSGLGEVVKHALMFDADLVELLQQQRQQVLDVEPTVMARVVEKNCRIKARVVEKDEREGGMRKLLNFGHTVGHALETVHSYRIPHGTAVLHGMFLESLILERANLLEGDTARSIRALCSSYLEGCDPLPPVGPGDLQGAMRLDKKNRAGAIHFVFPAQVGKPYSRDGQYAFPVADDIILEGLAAGRLHNQADF